MRLLYLLCLIGCLNESYGQEIIGKDSWTMFRGSRQLRGVAHAAVRLPLKLVWTFRAGDAVKSSPAIVGEHVYFGSSDGRVYSASIKSGKQNWAFATDDMVESSPLVLNGTAYIGSSDFSLYALDAKTGKKRWNYKTGGKILGSPNWVEGKNKGSTNIIIGSYDNQIHCIDSNTGKLIWGYETDNFINGAPTVFQENLLFGGCDGNLYVVSSENGVLQKSIDIGIYMANSVAVEEEIAYLGHYGNKCMAIDIKNSKTLWTYFNKDFPYFSSPAVWKDYFVIGGRDKFIHCINRRSGKKIWALKTKGRVDSSPVITDNKVIVGSDDGRLYVIDLQTGSILWKYDIGQSIKSSPAVIQDTIIVGADDGVVYCFGR